MHNRLHRPNNGDGERVRGRTKTGQSKDARDDKERWSIPEEECPMVSRPRQLQRYGWKGSRKLLLIPSIPARHQPHQIPDRNDECSSGYSRLGKIALVHGQGLRKSSSNPYEPYREGKETLPFEDPPESCSRVGGFGDGHSVAASGVFPVGKEEMFVDEIDRLAA